MLVTGAGGQLGRSLRVACGGSCGFLFTDVIDTPDTLRLDITDVEAVRDFVAQNGVDVIVNCAAYTDVNKAESDVEKCALINAEAPGILASVMMEKDGLLLHVSTDYVFDGKADTPYNEDAHPAPESVYGVTKLQGEKAIISSGCRYVIIRTSWLYSEYGRNFVKTMLDLTASKPELKVVSDQVGTPTYALDLADLVCRILQSGEYEGIYHYSNEGNCSWYEFACAIAELSGHDACIINPCTTGEYPTPAKRPAYSVLDKSKVKATFGVEIPHWYESLKKCLKNLSE